MFNKLKRIFLPNLGFTMVELVMIVGIVAILGAITYVAINPGRRIGETRDARRWNDVNALAQAMDLYILDNRSIPTPFNITNIAEGEKWVMASSSGIYDYITCGGASNPRIVLTSNNASVFLNSLGGLPQDPEHSSPDSGYYATRKSNNIIAFGACNSYSGDTIEAVSKGTFPAFASICLNGRLEGDEVCDSSGDPCLDPEGWYSGSYAGAGDCRGGEYATCNADCTACGGACLAQ